MQSTKKMAHGGIWSLRSHIPYHSPWGPLQTERLEAELQFLYNKSPFEQAQGDLLYKKPNDCRHSAFRLAERQGIEPKHLTAYKSAFYFPEFQIGNETVTIFAGLFVRLCPLFVCLSHGFKDTTHFLNTKSF